MKRILFILAIMALLILPASANQQYCSLVGTNITPQYQGEILTLPNSSVIFYCTGWCGPACAWVWQNPASEMTMPASTDHFGYSIAPVGSEVPYYYFQILSGSRPASVNVTFSVSETTNFTTKIPGATIELSNGQTGITNSTGSAVIPVYPPGGSYTFSLSKSGYTPSYNISLGALGTTGGTMYASMSPLNLGGSGGVQTRVFITDGSTGTPIVGATLNLRDVQNNSWLNGTSIADGTIFNVPYGHTIDIYGSYPGIYTASQDLGTTPGGNYYLPLYMYTAAPIGSVNLFVYMREAGTGYIIKNADVDIKWGTGGANTARANTANSGTASFIVPNNTVITIASNPSGYRGQSMSLTTLTVDKQVTITLSKQTDGPGFPTTSPTDANGNPITAVPTYLDNCNPNANDYNKDLCSHNKDSELMAQLRDAGPGILGLAIIAVLFGLLKMIMKF